MPAKTEGKPRDLLADLLDTARREDLISLVIALTKTRPDARRECLDYLEKHVALDPEDEEDIEGESAFTIWDDLEFDLSELDQYGGGDRDLVDRVSDLLWDLEKKLKQGGVSKEYRRDLLGEVLPYIRSRNSGMEDQLYEVAYATCYDDGDLRHLAGCFEQIGQDWPIDHALALLQDMRPGDPRYHGTYAMKAAGMLEESFPEEILAFYKSGLGGLNSTRPRSEYAMLAGLMAKVRRVYVDILKTPEEWDAFARRVKEANIRRPAFQQEFARVIPGWKEIV